MKPDWLDKFFFKMADDLSFFVIGVVTFSVILLLAFVIIYGLLRVLF